MNTPTGNKQLHISISRYKLMALGALFALLLNVFGYRSAEAGTVPSYRLPWLQGNTATVARRDTSDHLSQVDFNLTGDHIVRAAKPGKVVFAKYSSNTTSRQFSDYQFANMVVIQHDTNEYSWYVHLANTSPYVSKGDFVGYSTALGVEGNTGYVIPTPGGTGLHLHFMVSTGTLTDFNSSIYDGYPADKAPWASGIYAVDFYESPWNSLSGTTPVSQNGAPGSCNGYESPGVSLFEHSDCTGRALIFFTIGPQNLTSASFAFMNDKVSSISVKPNWKLKVSRDVVNGLPPGPSRVLYGVYDGNKWDLSSDWYTDSNVNMNDSISYIECGTCGTSGAGALSAEGVDAASVDCPLDAPSSTPPPGAPNAPSNYRQTAATQTSVTLAWNDNSSDEVNFYIERWNGDMFEYNWYTGANVTSYTHPALQCGTTYYYHITAVNWSGQSAWSNVVVATTSSCSGGTAPAAPSNLVKLSSTSTSITIRWNDNSGNENSFRIYRWDGVIGQWLVWANVGSNVTSFTDTNLYCNYGYYYMVSAVNGYGESAITGYILANTMACGTVPNTPSGIVTTNYSQTSISLAWNDNSTNESGFRVYRWSDPLGNWVNVGTPGANVNNWTDSGLTCSTSYYYMVTAYNSYGESSGSAWNYTGTGACGTVPNAPSNLRQNGWTTQTSAPLAWNDNSGNEQGFKIYRGDNSYTSWYLWATVGANVTNWTDTGLTCGQTKYYKVTAYNGNGESAASDFISAPTQPCGSTVPNAPTNLRQTGSSWTSITLSWTDNSNNESGFNVYRWFGSNGWQLIGQLGANITSFTDTDMFCSSSINYEVKAYNGNGESGSSGSLIGNSTACGSNAPNAPTNLRQIGSTSNSTTIAWDDNSDNETGFGVYRWDGLAGRWVYWAYLDPNVTTFTDVNLSCNYGYYYTVAAMGITEDVFHVGYLLAYTSACPEQNIHIYLPLVIK